MRSSPDGGLGTLVVGGDLNLNAGSQYRATVNADGGNSLLVVAGHVQIAGATVAINAQPGTFGRVTQYAVLQAGGGLAGSTTTTSNVPTLEPWLSQTASTLFVTLLRTDLPLQQYATTANGAAVGGAFDRLRPSATGDLAQVTRELTALDDPALASALGAVSGEIHASSVQLAALDGEAVMDLVRGKIAERSAPTESSVEMAPSPRVPHRTWAQWHDQHVAFDSTSAAHGSDAGIQGFALGMDWTMRDRWFAGIGGGYATGRLTLDGLAESSDATAPRALGYVGYAANRWTGHVGASVARMAYSTRRAFRFAALTPLKDALLFEGVDRQATSASSALATEFWGEERFDARVGSWMFSPSVGVRYGR